MKSHHKIRSNKQAQQQRKFDKMNRLADKPCSYKKIYRKKTYAEQAAEREGILANKYLYVYRCSFCKCYHLTSSPPRQKVG